jgi:NitT/TauT family transport system permease protein
LRNSITKLKASLTALSWRKVAGGAWNASIVAEYFHFQGKTLSTVGLGAVISHATDTGNFRVLLAATICMAAMVVTLNRLVWRRMYALASTKFKLET